MNKIVLKGLKTSLLSLLVRGDLTGRQIMGRVCRNLQVHIFYLKVGGESFWDEGVPLHDLVEHLVGLDRGPHVAQQHLKTRPERQQRVHEVTRLQVWPEQTNVTI